MVAVSDCVAATQCPNKRIGCWYSLLLLAVVLGTVPEDPIRVKRYRHSDPEDRPQPEGPPEAPQPPEHPQPKPPA
jgi:hypothetical protein